MKHCDTCLLADKVQNVCRASNLPIDPFKDYCSKHVEEVYPCYLCGHHIIGKSFITYNPHGDIIIACENCIKTTCRACSKASVCEFETNPDPMPKVIVERANANGMIIQHQVKNPERVKKFCHSCYCWHEESGCMKNYNMGCPNLT